MENITDIPSSIHYTDSRPDVGQGQIGLDEENETEMMEGFVGVIKGMTKSFTNAVNETVVYALQIASNSSVNKNKSDIANRTEHDTKPNSDDKDETFANDKTFFIEKNEKNF